MATTSNFGWTTPNDSDLVRDGASAIRSLGSSIDSSLYTNTFNAGKNKIINGDFGIWQRGTSFTSLSSGTYNADRWRIGFDGSGSTRNITRQTFTPGTAPLAGYEGQYFLRYECSVAGSGQTFGAFNQRVEDVRNFAGQTAVLSFWAKAAATTTLNLDINQVFGSGGSTTVNITLSPVTLTTSWVRYSAIVAFPSVSGKTIGDGSYLQVNFVPPYNSTFTVDFWGVQLEAGSVATAFQTATGTLQGELAACQRYYWRLTPSETATCFANGINISTTAAEYIVNNPVPMRVTATAVDGNLLRVLLPGTNAWNITALTLTTSQSSPNTSYVQATVASGLTQNQATMLQKQNSSSAYLGFTAEL